VREIFNAHGMYGRWSWRGLLAYGVGFLVMIPFFSTEHYKGPVARALGGADIAMLVGLPVAALVYLWACRSLDLEADKAQAFAADIGLDPDAAMGYAPEAVRYLLLSVPYRKKLNFTFDGLQAAATSIDRLRNFKLRLDTDKFAEGRNEQIEGRTQAALQKFEDSLDDDLNTAEALGAIFEYVRDVNTSMDNGDFLASNLPSALNLFIRFDDIVDVLRPTQKEESGLPDAAVEKLIEERVQAKKAKNFSRSDEIRKQLLEAGVILEDTKEGTRWKRK